jgi:predicted Zn-dependent protease with MMP-like domain
MKWENITQTILSALFSFGLFLQSFFQGVGLLPLPCTSPLTYSIGHIDPRFGISEDQVKEALSRAEGIWEKQNGRNLFEYQSTGGLAVNLVYDKRQEKTDGEKELEKKRQSLEEGTVVGVDQKSALYERARQEYDALLGTYEKKLNQYNEQVTSVNKEGGADEKTFRSLRQEKESLSELFAQVEEKRNVLNNLAQQVNQHIRETKKQVTTFNNEVADFESLYGGAETFDQGVYTGQDITIYQYDTSDKLALVLAHELGHALGIDHVDDPKALMYYLMKEQNVENIALTKTDEQALQEVCAHGSQLQKTLPWFSEEK